MTKLYVPINIERQQNSFNLYEVESEISGITLFNGCSVLSQQVKLDLLFKNECFDFRIIKEKSETPFLDFNGNKDSSTVDSISLGIFCSAYAKLNNRQLKDKYDSIIVTGNYNIAEYGKINLADVIYIEGKFKAAKQYAKNHADKKHLFIYVSKNPEIKEGETDNLLVIRFSPADSINLVFAEIFEPIYTDLQQQSLIPLTSDVNFIETKEFLIEKKKLARLDDWQILLLYGEQNSGKTLVAKELCKYLMTVNNCTCDVCSVDEKLEEIILENRKCKENEKLYKYIDETLVEEYGKVASSDILLIDNVQTVNIDDFLEALKSYKKYQNIVITSWYNSKINNKKNFRKAISSLNLLNQQQFSNFVRNLLPYEVIQNNNSEISTLISFLYEKYSNLPGYIPTITRSIPNNGLKNFIEKLRIEDLTEFKNKTEFALKQALKYMDFFNQAVLYSILGNRQACDAHGKIEKLNPGKISYNIKNVLLKEPQILTDDMIQASITRLCALNIIQIKRSKRRGEFIEIKDSIAKVLLFSDFKGQPTELLRKLFIFSHLMAINEKRYKMTELINKRQKNLLNKITSPKYPKLKDLAEVFTGLSIPATIRTKREELDYLIIKPQYIFDYTVHLGNNCKYYCSKNFTSSIRNVEKYFLKKGDIVVNTKKNNNGSFTFAIYNADNNIAIANLGIVIIRPKDNYFASLENFFSSEEGKKQFDEVLKLFYANGIEGGEVKFYLSEISIPLLPELQKNYF